jgi:phosphate acetyltransferase
VTERLFVVSPEGRTGKSTIAAGIIEALRADGRAVVPFRPVVRSLTERDPILGAILDRLDLEVPYDACVGTDYEHLHRDPTDAIRLIVERAAELEAHGAVVVIGSDYTNVSSPAELATNARLAANLAAAVVLVVGGVTDGRFRSAAEIAEVADIALGELRDAHATVSAIVVTRADPEQVGETAAVASAADAPLPVWVVPEDRKLTAPLLSTLWDAVAARPALESDAVRETPVPDTVLAAGSLENVLTRLAEGCLVIVSGDRPEVVLGVLVAHLSESSPALSGLLVSGGIPISPQVRDIVDGLSAGIPIGETALETFEAASRVRAARSRLLADSPAKYDRALELFAAHVDGRALLGATDAARPDALTPARFEHSLVQRARTRRMRIVLPEGDDDRILQAAAAVTRQGIAEVILLGDESAIRDRAGALGIAEDLEPVAVVAVTDPELHARFAAEYLRLRGPKGVTAESAAVTVRDVSYFGTLMVHLGLADGMVSGARHTTAHTVRPSFEIIKTRPGVDVVSSVFLMALADRVLVYGDCAIVVSPTVSQLADIAISSAATARLFGVEPRVAMLSYSTGESGAGDDVDVVRSATALVRERAPELPVAGPIQYDAAADPEVSAIKLPDSAVAGHATVYVFPDLDAGNTTYKAVQRSADAVAIGPVLQGLAKPVNDLSRGATVRDIVSTIAITAIQAQETA